MPTICRFYGIKIQMFFKDHGVPHFHARYGGRAAVFQIKPFRRRRGQLASRAERLVREWAELHQEELMRNWEQLRQGRRPNEIEPLR